MPRVWASKGNACKIRVRLVKGDEEESKLS